MAKTLMDPGKTAMPPGTGILTVNSKPRRPCQMHRRRGGAIFTLPAAHI
jgi:hypothetical protein